MEGRMKEEKETTIRGEKRKRKWGSLIYKFLMYGG